MFRQSKNQHIFKQVELLNFAVVFNRVYVCINVLYR